MQKVKEDTQLIVVQALKSNLLPRSHLGFSHHIAFRKWLLHKNILKLKWEPSLLQSWLISQGLTKLNPNLKFPWFQLIHSLDILRISIYSQYKLLQINALSFNPFKHINMNEKKGLIPTNDEKFALNIVYCYRLIL